MTPAKPILTREQLLAAEIVGYSFANYRDHLGMGNDRYERQMPTSVMVLEGAARELWLPSKVAARLETDEENARDLLDGYHRAKAVIDAENPAEGFRNVVRFAIRDAVARGLSTSLPSRSWSPRSASGQQISPTCWMFARSLCPDISRHLRKEPDVEYHDGTFNGDDA